MPEPSWQKLPFDEAIAFFKQKLPLPTTAWDEIINEAQDWAFTVAGLSKAEFLNDLYQALEKALEQGTTYEEFKQDFDIAAAKAGWQPPKGQEGRWGGWRIQLIYMQNLRGAYAAGRLKQMRDPEVAAARPYWMWRHRDSRVPRPAHLALDGKVFRGDSVFWEMGYPPCGYGCKCSVFALSDRDLRRKGLKVETPPTETVTLVDRVTGDRTRVPAINGEPVVEPGFAHAPGSSTRQQRQKILQRSLARLPQALRQQAEQSLLAPSRYAWKPFMTKAEAAKYTQGTHYAGQVFFHGTSEAGAAELTASGFDPTKIQNATYGSGFYASSDLEAVKQFPQTRGMQPTVLKMQLRSTNPRIFKTTSDYWDFVDSLDIPYDDAMGQRITGYLKQQGFDAIELTDIQYFVVFEPQQVAIFERIAGEN